MVEQRFGSEEEWKEEYKGVGGGEGEVRWKWFFTLVFISSRDKARGIPLN